MEHLGIDVHKVESQICILTESGEVVERRIQRSGSGSPLYWERGRGRGWWRTRTSPPCTQRGAAR